MSSKDAAALLIGINACTSATSAAEVLEKYKSLKLTDVYPSTYKLKYYRNTVSDRHDLIFLITELFDLCMPTIGKIDFWDGFFRRISARQSR